MKKIIIPLLVFMAISSLVRANDSIEIQLKDGAGYLHNRLAKHGKTPEYLLEDLKRAAEDFDHLLTSDNLNFLLSGVRCYYQGNIKCNERYAFVDWPFEPELRDVDIFGILAYKSRVSYFKSFCGDELGIKNISLLYEAIADLQSPAFYQFYNASIIESLACIYSKADGAEVNVLMSSYIGEDARSFKRNILFLLSSIKTRSPQVLYNSYSEYLIATSISLAREIRELVNEGNTSKRLMSLLGQYSLSKSDVIFSNLDQYFEKYDIDKDRRVQLKNSAEFNIWRDFFDEFEIRSSLGDDAGLDGLIHRYEKIISAYTTIGGERELMTSILVKFLD